MSGIIQNFKLFQVNLEINYLPFVGIPSRKINNTTRSSAESRNGLNSVEGEARGGGAQPVLSASGEEPARLGKRDDANRDDVYA